MRWTGSRWASFSGSALLGESTTAEDESLRSGKGEAAWESAVADAPVEDAAGGSLLASSLAANEGERVGLVGEAERGVVDGVLATGGRSYVLGASRARSGRCARTGRGARVATLGRRVSYRA